MALTEEQLSQLKQNLEQHRITGEWFEFGPPFRKFLVRIVPEKVSRFRTVYKVEKLSGKVILEHDTGLTCKPFIDTMLKALIDWDSLVLQQR